MRRVAGFLLVTSLLISVAPPSRAASGPVIGLWPQTFGQLTDIESASGISIPYFRGRMRDGQFDTQLAPSDDVAASAAGYSIGMNIQPKTGSGANRTGILYTDISAQIQAGAGPYYDKLVSMANEVLALPGYGVVPNYLQFHSEANIQAAPGVPSAHPYSGTGPEYQQCYALIHQLFDSLGVTNKIYWQIVLTRAAYVGNQGGPQNWYPSDPSLYDLVGVDAYYQYPGWFTPSSAFDAAFAFAQTQGKQVWIDETGADEGGPTLSPTAKAEWFGALDTYLEANRAALAGVVFSHSSDDGNWFLDSVLGGGRAVPNYTGISWNGWVAAVTDLSTFVPARTLSVSLGGAGSGSVMSAPSGIDCGTTCSAGFPDGTALTLTATPSQGSVFAGWSGDVCTGTGTCDLTMDADENVTATFTVAQHTVTVTTTGSGTGSITSDMGGIDCPGTCTADFDHGSAVVLTATPDADTTFAGWSGGGCSGTDPCTVTIDDAMSVNAEFDLSQGLLTVGEQGNGTGTVTSDVGGISCPGVCGATYADGSPVVLTAAGDANSVFAGWSGACAGPGTCNVTMEGTQSVTATFTLVQHTLTVTTTGAGTGTITSDPGAIDCPGTCAADYDHGTAVTLSETPDANSVFAGWSGGGCSGTTDCTVTISGATSVNAQFDLVQHLLSVGEAGSGNGTITSDVGGLNCPGVCGATYPYGTPVVLSANVGPNSTFGGWTGGVCAGTGPTCDVTVDGGTNVTATFTLVQHALSIAKVGNGTGTVTSDVGGIVCGGTCSANYDHGTAVVLSETPDANVVFGGWSGGGCSGTGICDVTVDAVTSATAEFDVVQRLLTVGTAGNGSGTITSDVGGISCPGACGVTYPYGTPVVLSANVGTNSVFTGWSGGVCSGTGATCNVTVDAGKNVTATFALVQHALTVTKNGSGTGTVSSDVGGINCGATCMSNYDHGSAVVLTETPDANMVFAGWSGGVCSGAATTCNVSVSAAVGVAATFNLIQHALTVTEAGTGAGSIVSNPGGINCPGTCAVNYNHGAAVVLTATPTGGSTFAGWSGACSGTGGCNVTLNAAVAVTGTFNPPATVTTLKDSSPAVAYDGWKGVADGAANGGSYRMSNVKNAKVTWTSPASTSLTWVTRTGPDQGKASVTIDGVNKGTVDLYSASPAALNKVFSGLHNQAHTVVIKVLGAKNAASTGLNVRLDAFIAGSTTTQESDPSLRYDGWASTAQALATDGSYRSSAASMSTVTVTFTGTSIDWKTTKGKAFGKASVRIDGVARGTVDLYQPATAWQFVLTYGGLSGGPHAMVIQVLGQKNNSATAKTVVVDGFIVHGS